MNYTVSFTIYGFNYVETITGEVVYTYTTTT